MLEAVNSAIPGLALGPSMVRHVFSGLLPARSNGSAELSVRPQFTEHAKAGGPHGFFSVFGIKFTTSRRVAINTLDRIFGKYHAKRGQFERPELRSGWHVGDLDINDEPARKAALAGLQRLISDESVVHLSDLVVRRTDLWESPASARALTPDICGLFSWDEKQRILEIDMLECELSRGDT
jgi:glycerol-3-phosphate dehydrogenase